VTSRHATEAEIDRLASSFDEQLALFRAAPDNAARVVQAGSPNEATVERAAWVMIANALLNLDETVTK
jgi:hypothetical protein